MVEKKFFRYLKNKPNGSASSSEIIKDLLLKTTDEGFNSTQIMREWVKRQKVTI
jgi:hypothetical protein